MGEKLERGLDKEIIDFIMDNPQGMALKNLLTNLKGLDVFVGIRNNYIDIYYEAFGAMNIGINASGAICKTNNKFWGNNNKDGYREIEISSENLSECIKGIKKHIYESATREDVKTRRYYKEKRCQHQIILKNNLNDLSDWYCVDMEYVLQRKDASEDSYGRFDIVAISKHINPKSQKYDVALIELKVDSGAFDSKGKKTKTTVETWSEAVDTLWRKGKKVTLQNREINKFGSGILGHFSDYVRYMASDGFNKLKREICNIISNKRTLGLCAEDLFADLDVEKISEVPQIVFLIYARDEKESSLITKFNNRVNCGCKYSIGNVWDKNIIDEYKRNSIIKYIIKQYPFTNKEVLDFRLFSDVEISEAKNIFDEEAYK